MASNRRSLYLQGILENLSRHENLRVIRFTFVETFFIEGKVKVNNFYQLTCDIIA